MAQDDPMQVDIAAFPQPSNHATFPVDLKGKGKMREAAVENLPWSVTTTHYEIHGNAI
jgi:hypothetical protein